MRKKIQPHRPHALTITKPFDRHSYGNYEGQIIRRVFLNENAHG